MSRDNLVWSLLLTILTIPCSLAAPSQSDIDSFWVKFKNAVSTGDKDTVAELTRFPLEMPYGTKSVNTRSDFIHRYDSIMNMEANAQRCFSNAKLEKHENQYEIACTFKQEPETSEDRPIVYSFTRTKTGWKFSGIDNVNE